MAQVVWSEPAAFLESVASFIISRLSSPVLLKLLRTCLFLICSQFWIWSCDHVTVGVGGLLQPGCTCLLGKWFSGWISQLLGYGHPFSAEFLR